MLKDKAERNKRVKRTTKKTSGMREIKFRAWDGVEMHYKVCINHEMKAIKYGYRSTDWVKDADAGIAMQFTGLKDKNGKEIYEGDIVNRGVITFNRGKFTGTYYDGNGELSDDWEDDLYQNNDLEILGNIYENPELLNQ